MSATFDFADCLTRLRSRDALTYEAAYEELLPRVREHVPELLAALEHGGDDAYTRGKLIELLGDAQDRTALSALARELRHPDPNVRRWAVTALLALCDSEADAVVEEHRRRRPEDFV